MKTGFLQKMVKGISVSIAVSVVVSVLGMLALWAAYLIPVDSIRKNVAKSVPLLAQEGRYPPQCAWAVSTLDNYTDSLMLMEAAHRSNDSAFQDAMSVPRFRVCGKDDYDSFCVFTADSQDGELHKYARYWHGYHIVLKPLLVFLHYGEIRTVNFVVQSLLSLVIIGMMCWRKLLPEALAYLSAILMMVPNVIASCMEFSLDFYVFSFSCIMILCLRKKMECVPAMSMLFSVTGAMTAYFDYLTYPIATFGMPMVLSLCLCQNQTVRKECWMVFACFVFWGCGYALTWGFKWVLATVLTEQNIILDAFGMIMNRTSTTVSYAGRISIGKMYGEVISVFTGSPFLYVSGAVLLFAPIVAFFAGRRNVSFKRVFPLVVVALFPFGWYAFARNHSFIHSYFTCKGLVVAFFALPCALAHVFVEHIEKRKENYL